MIVTYTAQRSTVAGHSTGLNYSLEIDPMQLDRKTETIRNKSISLSGREQNTIDRRDIVYTVTTKVFDQANSDYGLILEFLESVDEFEPFSVDVDGFIGTPTSNVSAVIIDNYDRQRYSNAGEFLFRFSFRVTA